MSYPKLREQRVLVEHGALDEWDNIVLYWPRIDAARVRAIKTMAALRRRGGKAYEGWGSFINYFVGYLGEEAVSVEMLARGVQHRRELRCDGRSGDVDITLATGRRVEVKCARNPDNREFSIGVPRKMDWDCVVHVVNRALWHFPEDGYLRCAAWATAAEVRAMKVVERRGGWPCYAAKHESMRQMADFWAGAV